MTVLTILRTSSGSGGVPTRPARLQELLAGIGAAIDAAGGSFTMQYATVAVSAVRTGTA